MNKWNKIKKTDLRSLGEAPTEASENIKAPELAPKDNRFTGRNKRISFTSHPEFAEKLRKLAFEENCYQIEILEKALECYEKHRKTINREQKEKPQQCGGCFEYYTKEYLKEVGGKNYCLACYEYAKAEAKEKIKEEKEKLTNQSLNEQFFNTCSFYLEENATLCDKPLFDKKKQLCRSHNKQVWKKFNAFLKGQSVSSTAAWLGTWEESGDWKWFWDLGVEREKNKVLSETKNEKNE